MDYAAALHGKATTLSNVRVYRGRKSGLIYYLPGGRDASIACLRCPMDWRLRSQIGALDYVTVAGTRKIAVEIRSKTGHPMMTRAAALHVIREMREDILRATPPEGHRKAGWFEKLLLSALMASVFTGLSALALAGLRWFVGVWKILFECPGRGLKRDPGMG